MTIAGKLMTDAEARHAIMRLAQDRALPSDYVDGVLKKAGLAPLSASDAPPATAADAAAKGCLRPAGMACFFACKT